MMAEVSPDCWIAPGSIDDRPPKMDKDLKDLFAGGRYRVVFKPDGSFSLVEIPLRTGNVDGSPTDDPDD